MVTTVREYVFHDESCILSQGDHSFIVKPSYVLYKDLRLIVVDEIARELNVKFFQREMLEKDVLDRVCDGIGASDFTPPWAVAYVSK